MVRKIVEKVPDDVLKHDLEKYRQRALELGATDAKIITTDMIVIDEKVRAKCIWPRCTEYGTSVNCPPYTMDVDQTKKIVNNFRYAIFTKMHLPPKALVGPESDSKMLRVRSEMKEYKIISEIEAEAFYDGYYLALGFAAGSCKIMCPNTECSALIPGQACRHHYKSRPSMEGVGMDVFLMATKVGWDIYPIGISTLPSEAPHALLLGLVLIY